MTALQSDPDPADEFARFRTDHLLLLMGTNPLPNYVAARLLARPDTHLRLVVTDEIRPTNIPSQERLPDRFLKLLGRDSNDESHYVPVKSADPHNIYTQVYAWVDEEGGSWGLHYTGGKKSMATHTYRAVRDALAKRGEKGVFSYLDADSLEMVFDYGDEQPTRSVLAHSKVQLPLAKLLELHGQPESVVRKVQWEEYAPGKLENRQLGGSKQPQRFPFRPEVCEALLAAWLDDPAEMKRWRDQELTFKPCRLLAQMYATAPVEADQLRDALILACDQDPRKSLSERNRKKLRMEKLAKVTVPTCVTSNRNPAQSIGGLTIESLAREWKVDASHLVPWFRGFWLEDYVLNVVRQLADDHANHINDYALGLESSLVFPIDAKSGSNERGGFESDVIFTQGYRLFYVSVTTDDKKDLNKSKVFEAYVRARQLGGDEAQVGLVTFYADPARLGHELSGPLGDKVKVFGPQHLLNLKQEFIHWLNSPKTEA